MPEAKHPSTVPYPPLLRFDVTIWLQPAEGPALTLAESIQLDPER